RKRRVSWVPLGADGEGRVRPRLHDPQAGDLQRQVLVIRKVDQLIERRIVERVPPRGVGRRALADARVVLKAPVLIDRDRGLDELRPDGGASGERDRQDYQEWSNVVKAH